MVCKGRFRVIWWFVGSVDEIKYEFKLLREEFAKSEAELWELPKRNFDILLVFDNIDDREAQQLVSSSFG